MISSYILTGTNVVDIVCAVKLITNIHLTNGFLSDTKALLIPGVRPTAKGVSSAVSIRKIYWDATLKLHLLDSVVMVSVPDPIPKSAHPRVQGSTQKPKPSSSTAKSLSEVQREASADDKQNPTRPEEAPVQRKPRTPLTAARPKRATLMVEVGNFISVVP